MSDENPATNEVEDTQETDATNEATQEGQEDGGKVEDQNEDSSNESSPEDELPEWARDRLSKANSEAAKYRTQLRDAQEALSNAKTAEDVEEAKKDLTKQIENLQSENLRTSIAYEMQVPPELADRLRGGTEEELRADAKALLDLVGQSKQPATREPNKPKGGLNPGQDDEAEIDFGDLWRQSRGLA